MSVVKVKCPVCESENVSKNSTSKVGKQQYICNNKQCHKSSFILDYTYNACKPEVKNKIIPITLNGSGIRDISRVLKIGTTTVMNCIKKEKYININLLEQKEKTNPICIDMIKVEVDELWSFVKNKKNQRWLWYVIDHDTGEILAYTFAKRKDTVFLKLKKLLKAFQIEIYYSDNWTSYKKYIEEKKHKIGKKNTQKIERKNLTLRTRIKRLARKTICYSKTEYMHDIIIGLFINTFEFDLSI